MRNKITFAVLLMLGFVWTAPMAEAAKKAKDYAKADEIRKHLAEQGVMLVDTPQGTTWQRVLVEKSN